MFKTIHLENFTYRFIFYHLICSVPMLLCLYLYSTSGCSSLYRRWHALQYGCLPSFAFRDRLNRFNGNTFPQYGHRFFFCVKSISSNGKVCSMTSCRLFGLGTIFLCSDSRLNFPNASCLCLIRRRFLILHPVFAPVLTIPFTVIRPAPFHVVLKL